MKSRSAYIMDQEKMARFGHDVDRKLTFRFQGCHYVVIRTKNGDLFVLMNGKLPPLGVPRGGPRGALERDRSLRRRSLASAPSSRRLGVRLGSPDGDLLLDWRVEGLPHMPGARSLRGSMKVDYF